MILFPTGSKRLDQEHISRRILDRMGIIDIQRTASELDIVIANQTTRRPLTTIHSLVSINTPETIMTIIAVLVHVTCG